MQADRHQVALWNWVDRLIHDDNGEPSVPGGILFIIVFGAICFGTSMQWAGVWNFRALF